jgi:hypothetical protein
MCRPCVRRGGLRDSGLMAAYPALKRRAVIFRALPGLQTQWSVVGCQSKAQKAHRDGIATVLIVSLGGEGAARFPTRSVSVK